MNYQYLLNSILSSLDEGVFVVDSRGIVTLFNDPASDITGIGKVDVTGKHILEVFDGLTEETSTLCRVLQTKKAILDHIQTYLNASGEEVSIVTSTIPLIEEGRLVGALEIYRALSDAKRLKRKIETLEKALEAAQRSGGADFSNGTRYVLGDLIGTSESILSVKDKALRIADSRSPVLVYGETGTGKEILVQGIHNAGTYRKEHPFIAQNCAAIPRDLLEGLLFGTSAGSFTGAKEKPGLFELADGGTLLLDEINSMDLNLQAKLLRVIQDGRVRRVGGEKEISVDVRVIASTNVSPMKAADEGRLREDLYYRLSVIELHILPLRDRIEDLPLIAEYYIDRFNSELGTEIKGFSSVCMDTLSAYSWPGNVRQLRSMIESIMNFTEGKLIEASDLPAVIRFGSESLVKESMPEQIQDVSDLKRAMEDYERNLIVKAVELSGGNYARAARSLNIPKQTLHNKVKKYGFVKKVTLDESPINKTEY